MSKAQNFIKSWHDNLHVQNVDFLEEILDENVVFYSPVVFKPIQGKDMTKLYLASAGESFNMESFKYVREVHQAMESVLEFETDIDGIWVNGIDMITWNAAGKIIDFKVMIRPLKAVEIVRMKMVESLEQLSKQA
tara:strand:- start:294 stop:698 length:405 start_codon:yes stop_codon:yes gene_type:complete